jgi:transposase-like protein
MSLNSGNGEDEMKLRKDGQPRGAYTLEFKLEAIRLVESGQTVTDAAKILGIPNHTLDYVSPRVFEQRCRAAQNQDKEVA